jgi:hypothetical protein
MVSALLRKEPEQTTIHPVKSGRGYVREPQSSKIHKDNFPYALREFINSHMDLPTLEEIARKQSESDYSLNVAR